MSSYNKINFEFHDLFPWENKNIFLAGGYLLDIMLKNEENNHQQEDKKDLIDIDIFVFGSIIEKKKSLMLFFENLSKTSYDYIIGINGCLISVFIKNKPLIIQFIMSSEISPKELVKKFDFTILHSYYDGFKIYSENYVIEQIKTKTSSIIYKNPRLYRIVKYTNKDIKFNIDEIFTDKIITIDVYGFTLLMREKKQKDIYAQTNNLSCSPYANDIDCEYVKKIIYQYFGYNTIIDKNNIIEYINNDNNIIWNNIFERKLIFNDEIINKLNIDINNDKHLDNYDSNKNNDKPLDNYDYNKNNDKSLDNYDYNKNNDKSIDNYDYNKNDDKSIDNFDYNKNDDKFIDNYNKTKNHVNNIVCNIHNLFFA